MNMAPAPKRGVFQESILPQGQSRLGFFGAGFGMECLALAIVIVIPMLMPSKFVAAQHYWVMPIEAPHIEPYKPQPVKPAPVVKVKREVVKEIPKPVETPEIVAPPQPKVYSTAFSAPVVKTVVKKSDVAPDVQVTKALPDPALMGSSAPVTIRKPKEDVQTGGFGDPNSIPDNGKTNRNPNMTSLGAYDMPAGPGTGNGTGGANGAKGVVASTGFGNGVATGTTGGSPRGSVQQGLFGDEKAGAAGPRVKQTAAAANTIPVQILFKPKPVYTDEARSKKIEGDVLLEVVFTAAGEVKVQRVVHGLGYGLEDSAESAARQIRFKPAQESGQPVDSTAIVHITFELAY